MEDGREGSNECRYTLPGVLHFLQHDWSRFELERVQWDAEKAELTAKIAFLQGERRGQENIKRDLIRRIKMLEFALKKERIKVQKLKGLEPGPEPTPPDVENIEEKPNEETNDLDNDAAADSDLWAGGRQMLRQYLQEVGFTDTILDARSARLRALLGGTGPHDDEDEYADAREIKNEFLSESGGVSVVDDIPLEDKEAMDEFNFLNSEDGDWNPNREKIESMKNQLAQERRRKRPPRNPNEVNGETSTEGSRQKNFVEEDTKATNIENETGRQGEIDLGELAQLTTANEADPLNLLADASNSRRSWNQRYTLRSHLDGVRSVKFHPTESLVLSGSEDQLVKVWNLSKNNAGKRTAQFDIEPIINYRGHDGPVLSVEWGHTECFSGGLDGQIFAWPIPRLETELYDPWSESILGRRFVGHTDSVWSLSVQNDNLLTCSADGTVKIWNIETAEVKFNYSNEVNGIPSDAKFTKEFKKIIISWTNNFLTMVDIETGSEVMKFENCCDVNSIASHPNLPIAVTAHEDRNIRFWDLSSGTLVHSMVAHLDAVTSVTIDPNGLYLLSGSHDASIRLWGFESKTCVQEFTAHRPKFNEAVHQASFHPNKGYVASAGADGLIKIFV